MTTSSDAEPSFFFSAETLEVTPDKSVARISLQGLNARVINKLSATTYTVESGTGTMEIDGSFHELYEGVCETIPRGTPYQDEGNLTMLATSVPPFEEAAIVYV